MSTLDRYIARQYLFNVLALLVVLFSFVVAVDVALNIDRFLDTADSMNPDGGSIRRFTLTLLGIFNLWSPRLLQLYTYIIGLVLVAAMGFTFTQFVRHRETVAVLAGGISLYRLARPVLIVALGFMVLKMIDHEFILSNPRIAPLLARDQGEIGKRSWSQFPVQLVKDGSNRVFLAEKFDPNAGTLTNLTIWCRDAGGQAQQIIQAQAATWDGSGWALQNASLQNLTMATGGQSTAQSQGTPPSRVETDLSPETLKLKRSEAFSQTLSWSQISQILPNAQGEMRAKLQRIRWSRWSQAIASMLSLIITLPFFLVREPTNMLIQSLKCAPVGIISLMGGVLLSTVPWPGLPAGFAVFIPVLILAPVAIASVSWVKT